MEDKQIVSAPESEALPVSNSQPADLLQIAVQQNMSAEQLSKLMDLQERWEANQARKSFNAAFSKFQSVAPALIKTSRASFKNTSYAYIQLGDITEQIKPHLQACGLSYRFDIQDSGEKIQVTCIVSHIDGHNESTTMTASPDLTGSKNEIQSRGSTVTYLQRYSLVGALGLTTADADMDGRISSQLISEDQAADIKARLAATGSNVAAYCAALGIGDIDTMPASKFSAADKMLTRKEKAQSDTASEDDTQCK